MAEIKKKFFDIEIPLLNTEVKAYAFNIESLNNRTIRLDLTRILRGKSLESVIKVKANKEKAEGEIRKLNLMSFYIRRMIRNSISYIEDSFKTKCMNCELRVKPFMITRKRVSRRIRTALRNEAKRFLGEYFADKDHETIITEIISGRLQKSLSLRLKKIYPLSFCEIRQLDIIGEPAPFERKKKEIEKAPEKEQYELQEEAREEPEEKKAEVKEESKPEKPKRGRKKKTEETTEKTEEEKKE